MGRSIFRQDTQIRRSDTYADDVTPSLANYETNTVDLEDDLNNLRSQVQNMLNRDGDTFPPDNWYDDLTKPTTLEDGTIRGIDATNAALHIVEKKRVLREVWNLTDFTPGAVQVHILTAGQLPTQTTAAIGAVTTLGTVCATATSFGTASATDVVAGSTAISPKNMVPIVDADSRDPILVGGKRVYGLFQSESSTDGSTLSGTTPDRAQISFVVINDAGDDLELTTLGASQEINYAAIERVRLEDLNEQDFLKGATVDVPAASTVTRQVGYDNQGVTPVDQTTNAILDLEGAGLEWQIRDDAEAILFRVIEGSATSDSKVAVEDDVDEFDVDAVVSDFLNGAKFDTGAAGTTIDIGVTSANAITSGGTLDLVTAAASQLKMASGGRLAFTDTYEPAGWSLDGIALSDSAQEWTDFETAFGEVSLLNAIKQAYESAHRRRVFSVCTSTTTADNDLSGPSDDNNLDTDLGDLSGGTFLDDYDVFLNGQLLRPGADAAANNDYYPGTSLANGQLKFEFVIKINDVLCVIDHVA